MGVAKALQGHPGLESMRVIVVSEVDVHGRLFVDRDGLRGAGACWPRGLVG